MNVTSPSRRPDKTASSKATAPVGRPIAWKDVLRALSSDDARGEALSRYRAKGYTADNFSHLRVARSAMVEALVAVEDWLEMTHPRRERERLALRDCRRRLEIEVSA